jgi:hypothetical protein
MADLVARSISELRGWPPRPRVRLVRWMKIASISIVILCGVGLGRGGSSWFWILPIGAVWTGVWLSYAAILQTKFWRRELGKLSWFRRTIAFSLAILLLSAVAAMPFGVGRLLRFI